MRLSKRISATDADDYEKIIGRHFEAPSARTERTWKNVEKESENKKAKWAAMKPEEYGETEKCNHCGKEIPKSVLVQPASALPWCPDCGLAAAKRALNR